MDLGSGKGFGAVLRRRVRGGQIRSILPAWRIALLFEKGAKLGMGYKKRTEKWDYISGGDKMKNLVRVQKITNGRGSIKYITRTSKGEILASYSTQALQEWEILFDFNQQKFNEEKEKGNWTTVQKNKNGKIAQAIEAHMFVVALPNEMANYPCKYNGKTINNDMELAKAIANDWRSTYGTDCYVALHWNKDHTNFHAHILVSERIKKESSEIKRAKRNRYYDANGKECKKADAVRIVRKGDIIRGQNELYASGKIDLKSKKALDKIKEHYSKLLGTEMFKNDGLHIPQQHLPRVNENSTVEHLARVKELKQHNANIKEYNDLVDKLIETGRPQDVESIRPLVSEFKHSQSRIEYLMFMIQTAKRIYKAIMEQIKAPIHTLQQDISFKSYAAAKKNVSNARFGSMKKSKKIKIYNHER